MARVNEADLDWDDYEHGATAFRRKQLGEPAGGEALGCSLYELPPGRRTWPYHYHTANEEALYVLAGAATLRWPEGTATVQAGDYVAFPADERGAHRLVNESDEPVRFLLVSTMVEPDVTVYPDSGKFGAYAGAPPGGDEDERVVSGYWRLDDDVDYWEGEEHA